MGWIEKQKIKVGVGGQLAAAIATQSYHGALVLSVVGRLIYSVDGLAEQVRSVIGAFHYQVEKRTARRSRLNAWGPAAMRDL